MTISQPHAPPAAGGASAAYIELDSGDAVTGLSPGARSLLGYGAATAASDQAGDLLLTPDGHPVSREWLQAFLHQPAMAPFRATGLPLLGVTADGNRISVRVAVAAGDPANSVRLLLQPDNLHHPGEAAPQRIHGGLAEVDLAGILEAAPDFLAVLDPGGRIRFLNAGGLALLGGIGRDDCYGHPFTEFQPRAAATRFREESLPAALEQGAWRGETRLITAQGAEIPVDQTLVARPGEDGAGETLFTMVRDISDRKQEEARLRDSEEKYRRILEAAQEGFWIVHDQLQGDDDPPQLRYKVPVSKGSRIVLVDLPEVRYFQADGHYTQVYTGSGQFLCNLSVSDLERRLDAEQFVRIHRSYIINLEFLQVFERIDDQWCVTIGAGSGQRLPVSRRNVEKLKVILGVS